MIGLWGPLVRKVSKVAGLIWLLFGVLSLVACISIAISTTGEAESEIDTDVPTEIDKSNDIDIDEEEGNA